MQQRLSAQAVDQFKRDGFLNAGPVLSMAEVDELSSELDRIIARGSDGFREDEPRPVSYVSIGGDTDRPVWQIVNIWMASPAFERLIHHPFVVTAIRDLTGSQNLQVWHDQVQYKPAASGGTTAWHQDAPYWPAIEPMTEVSAWIPFDDADVENGCMWMVPGSHLWGNQIDFLHRQRDQHKEGRDFATMDEFTIPDGGKTISPRPVACPVRRGEVHFHHALTWHGSPHNHSPRPRRALAIHYMTSEAVFTGRNHLMSKYIKVAVGESMINAGAEFPLVLKEGAVVA
ncbi:MAG: phytanoyl-CoA dioxygenase family protein [Spirochaetaceae bacterium]|nr:MAG: phytanoyl-CoA dioxygenase family protein [Spirochaetaceae bacterium]